MTQLQHVTPHQLKEWMDKGMAILVDVRPSEEYEDVRIEGSILLPMESLQHAMLPHNPDKIIVFHCHKGERGARAAQACLEHVPHRRIYCLEGGIGAWIEAGFSVERGVDPGRL
ncbi:MAG TPA: hypothetical protein DDX54_05195 [Rhodospirillaceae bacterium]|jgi:rhodanese-related sulfurtransferase|nr:rhodanese-like domain-containing protein [Alphaproteobacteria bacterium]HBH26777.1 hypothetical protein [Rhodospirillaceae bacterium]